MRDSSTICANIVDVQSAMAMREAHEHASDFHGAIARAIECQAELASEDDMDAPYWRIQYGNALGEAALALQKMPMKWAAVLGPELVALIVPQQAAE
jgi:hypothetical protein